LRNIISGNRKIIAWGILFVIMFFSLGVRMQDYLAWKNNPDRAFFQKTPLLTNIDGYFYLRIAKDIVDGKYNREDPLRSVSVPIGRRDIPPLLSYITAKLHVFGGWSYEWIGVFLPTILGVLLVIPVYRIGVIIGGAPMGLSAALFAVMSNTYFVRTSLGWYDTDCLNVTLTLAAAVCFLEFSVRKTGKYIFLVLGLVNCLVFLLWWDQAVVIVAGLALYPLAWCVINESIKNKKQFGMLIIGGLTVFAIFLVFKSEFLLSVYNNLLGHFEYLTKNEVGDFPTVSQQVGEQRHVPFLMMVSMVTESYPVLIIGVAGLVWMFVEQFRKTMFLLMPLFIGLMGVLFAQRYLLFAGPVVALGIGFVLAKLWSFGKQRTFYKAVALVFVVLETAILTKTNMAANRWPLFTPQIVEGYNYIKENTSENAVIWMWWDLGHPMIYWTERAAISDGANHGGENSVYNALPFATDNYRLAANFIQFYVAHGIDGVREFNRSTGKNTYESFELLKNILKDGPEKALNDYQLYGLNNGQNKKQKDEWLTFLFPHLNRPVYLFIDYRLAEVPYWWYWFGTWDIRKHEGVHSRYIPFYSVILNEKGIYAEDQVYANLSSGRIILPEIEKNLNQINLYSVNGLDDSKVYIPESSAYLEVFADARFAALQRKDIAESVFNKLFLRHERTNFFKAVRLVTPIYQIYEVNGESYLKE